MTQSGATLRERIDQVESRIQKAAERSGRKRGKITLVAVTKKVPADVIREAYDLGLRVFGENYVQEFAGKHASLADLKDADFHLIGHLQSNKARMAVEMFHAIETVDSIKLAQRLQDAAASLQRTVTIMLEVKLSAEESKAGAAPEDLAALIAGVQACSNLKLTGLMTMPPWCDDPEQTRPYFRRLKKLADEYQLSELSMGMSHDLEAAIEEGSTHVRVGTALFGARPKL